MDTDPHSAAFDEIVERFGVFAEQEGLSRTAARLFGLMLLEGGPLSFDELVERLRASRGGVSTNARHLEAIGVLERTARPGDRRVYYRLAGSPYRRLVERTLERRRRFVGLLQEAHEAIPEDREDARGRFAEMLRFYDRYVERTTATLDEWSEDR